MKSHFRRLAIVLFSLFLVTAAAPWLKAQITSEVRAHIDHSFVVGDTTLPPGEYIFRMLNSTDLSVMSLSSPGDRIHQEFLVQTAMDDHTPRHTELIFRKFGNTEFLNKIFQRGQKTGVEVTETSRQEKRFVRQGEHGIEHTEEQP